MPDFLFNFSKILLYITVVTSERICIQSFISEKLFFCLTYFGSSLYPYEVSARSTYTLPNFLDAFSCPRSSCCRHFNYLIGCS